MDLDGLINDYAANQYTLLPKTSLDDAFKILEYQREQFEIITKEMPELDTPFLLFTELERRVSIKKQELGLE